MIKRKKKQESTFEKEPFSLFTWGLNSSGSFTGLTIDEKTGTCIKRPKV